jgi:hypothetical protein
MADSPPTVPISWPPAAGSIPRSMVLVSAGVHAVWLAMTSFIVPLLMGSNIWPIAGVFWSVLTVPVGALAGAGLGAMLRSQPRPTAMKVAWFTAIAMSAIAGVIISQNR